MSKPVRRGVAVVVTLVLLLPSAPVGADPGTARVFYYGSDGDGYLGMRHAASWWGQTPPGWPEVVDLVHYGIATSDWSIPFGVTVCFEIIAFPGWAEEEYVDLIGTVACGTVVDRMSSWVHRELGLTFDLWPALARRLMGEDYRRIGTAEVKVVLIRSRKHTARKGGDDKNARTELAELLFGQPQGKNRR